MLGTMLAGPVGAVAALRGLIGAVPAHTRGVVMDAIVHMEAGEWLALLG